MKWSKSYLFPWGVALMVLTITPSCRLLFLPTLMGAASPVSKAKPVSRAAYMRGAPACLEWDGTLQILGGSTPPGLGFRVRG
jgi:hypothetical protein